MQDRVKFLAAFVKRPFDTGSVTPSSTYLASAMVDGLRLEAADTVVELGSGTGPFTGPVLERLRPDAVFLCFEINKDLAEPLRLRFPRARVINDTVENLATHLEAAGRDCVDVVVSGLPWAAFTTDRQQKLLDAAMERLRPGGSFVTFAYPHAAWLPPGRRFKELLATRFARVETSPVVWRNVPPAFVYRCVK